MVRVQVTFWFKNAQVKIDSTVDNLVPEDINDSPS